MAKKLISIVVPVFNEEENVAPFYSAVSEALRPLGPRYDFEFVFTDNHSTDQTFARLRELAAADSRVRVYRFSRNFGYQRSILTGYAKCSGDAAIQMDVDLQDPPELLPAFLDLWEQGSMVVYGVRTDRHENWAMKSVRKLFYRLIRALSEDDLPLDAGDFRLVDRRVIDELTKFEDAQPYLRGSIAAIGFQQVGVPYVRNERQRGVSKFSFAALLTLALDGVLNHSIVPLRVATFLGLAMSALTLLGVVGYGVGRFVFGQEWPAGFATTTVLLLGSIALNAMFLGIIGEYLGRIYQQVKRKPITIIEAEAGSAARDRSAAGSHAP